jgi:hypothetical protein
MAKTIKQFKEESSPAEKAWVVGLIAAGLGLCVAAERDIHARPAATVRGSKLVWRLVSLNALGALSYFRWGRLGPEE